MLNVLVWLGFSFFRGTRVSPMNSLWRNLSSSHTEILEGEGRSQKFRSTGCLRLASEVSRDLQVVGGEASGQRQPTGEAGGGGGRGPRRPSPTAGFSGSCLHP